MMLVHRSRIDRLDVPARVIFSSPAVFKREALCMLLLDGLVTRRWLYKPFALPVCIQFVVPHIWLRLVWHVFIKSYISATLPRLSGCHVGTYHTAVLPRPKSFVRPHVARKLRPMAAPCGAGAPLFPLVHLLPHLFPFSLFPFFHWLHLFSSFVHPFPFYQNSPTPFPGQRS